MLYTIKDTEKGIRDENWSEVANSFDKLNDELTSSLEEGVVPDEWDDLEPGLLDLLNSQIPSFRSKVAKFAVKAAAPAVCLLLLPSISELESSVILMSSMFRKYASMRTTKVMQVQIEESVMKIGASSDVMNCIKLIYNLTCDESRFID